MNYLRSNSSADSLLRQDSEELEQLLANDTHSLERMGYSQELYRGFNSFMAIAFSFTSVAAVSSITSLFPIALSTGGPAVMVWSWVGASTFTILSGLSMAEISSAYPSAGSVYYWAGKMSPPEWAPVVSYVTGWFNLLGNAAADAFFAFTFSTFVDYACIMNGYEHLSVEALVVIGIGTMAIWSICNLLRVDQQGKIHTFAASLQIIFTVAVLVSLWSTCQQGQQASASDVFFKTYNGTGFASFPYVVLIGILSSLYSFTGYEAAAHMAEETQDASMAVPKGIVYTCIATAITGGLYILSLLFASAYHVEEFASSEIGATYIFQKCMGDRGANIMNYFILVNLFFSGMSSLTVTIRTAFAVARDGGFPFSTYVQQVNPRSKVPEYAVFAVFLMGSSLLLLQLISSTAFVAVTSTSTIGFQISYAIPIILRVTVFREKFQKADFHLGRWGVVCGRIAAIFLVTTSILFTFPVQYPITFENFNYTIVILAACATLGTIHWTFSGRYWFLGPGREHIVD